MPSPDVRGHLRLGGLPRSRTRTHRPQRRVQRTRERVRAARNLQLKRLQKYHIFCNAQMSHAMLKKTCRLTEGAQRLLALVFQQKSLSARSYDRIIKVARTIADLDGAAGIEERHIAEAVQLRNDIGLQPE